MDEEYYAAESLYESVPVTPKQTRLICLLDGTSEEPLRGDLIVVDVTANGLALDFEQREIKYTALSYTWGTGPFSRHIFLNDVLWKMKANLFDFLHQYRSEQRGGTYLWIGALVIHHYDSDEKSHQVARMLQFYEGAELVCMWLGKAIETTIWAMGFLRDLSKDSKRSNQSISDQALHGLRDLYSRSYPRRIWTRQEVWAAKRVVVRCGAYSMTLEDFKVGVIIFKDDGDDNDSDDSDVSGSDMYSFPNSLRWLHEKLGMDGQQSAAINFLAQRQPWKDLQGISFTSTVSALEDGRKDILSRFV